MIKEFSNSPIFNSPLSKYSLPKYLLSKYPLFMLICIFLAACGGGSNEDSSSLPPPPPTTNSDATFATHASTAKFLTQATFGPTFDNIQNLTGSSASEWFIQETQKPASKIQTVLDEYRTSALNPEIDHLSIEAASHAFWRNSIGGSDQLRQRMAFALSELLVVSNGGGETLTDIPEAVVYYQDVLIDNAFGNYRALLEAVTYSPAMGHYLTYLGSEKGDPETGRMPDENYAREILQLFSIGVVGLNLDGSVKTGEQGAPQETYNNTDITGLARVFTGLTLDPNIDEPVAWARPMQINQSAHSLLEKSFLGFRIPPNTSAANSIDSALDHIFSHSNVAPFISRQLIQRLVTSNPSPDYIRRVATAFEAGNYTLPNGQSVGSTGRGDLQATLAAILFDTEARSIEASNHETFGKVREPILRFTHWARAFAANTITPQYVLTLWDTSSTRMLGQHPYRSPSVFNFFRPGYVPPGSLSGAQGLTIPEMQIVNASSTPGYINYINFFIFNAQSDVDVTELQEIYDEDSMNLDARNAPNSFKPDYSREIALADNAESLVNHLNLLLTFNTLSTETKNLVIESINTIPATDEQARTARVMRAISMIMTSPDYLVQR